MISNLRNYFVDLVEKEVVLVSGEQLGRVADFVFQTERGTLESLLVKPDKSMDLRDMQKDRNGFYVIPMKAITSIKDYIVVDPKRK